MVENKWPTFRKVFYNFEIDKVARMDEKNIKALLKNPGIVRSEGKIRAMIYNAQEFKKVKNEFGSFKKYISSNDYKGLMTDMPKRFKFLGPSNTRSFLWLAGYDKLKPDPDEIAWLTKMTSEK